MNDSNHYTWVVLDRDGNLCESFESFNAADQWIMDNLIEIGLGDSLVKSDDGAIRDYLVRFLDEPPRHRAYAIRIPHTRRYGGLATEANP